MNVGIKAIAMDTISREEYSAWPSGIQHGFVTSAVNNEAKSVSCVITQAEAETIQLMCFYTYKTMETPDTGRYMNSTTPNNVECFQSFVTEQYNLP